MNRITIGLSKPRTWTALLTKPDIFIEVPVARNVCISFYLLHITNKGTTIRLADRFYKNNKVIFSKALKVSYEKEKALVDWGKTQNKKHTTNTVGVDIFKKILKFKNIKSSGTENPFNLIKILHNKGEEKVKYSCVNFLKL